jgi:cytochrome c oxidase cbb3-type subunit 3
LAAAACQRSDRSDAEAGAAPLLGGANPPRTPGSVLLPGDRTRQVEIQNPYWKDADAIRDGERLYNWYNCSGCHAGGGGGMGPPLIDDRWIYGSSPVNIFDTIYEGRAGGMPAFGEMLPEQEIWKLVAYVQSISKSEASGSTGSTGGGQQQQRQSNKQQP